MMKRCLLRKILSSIVFGTMLFIVMGDRHAEAQQTEGPDKAKIEAARAFYKGKSLEFVVPFGPGGSYDAKARMMAPFMEKYLPGSKILVKNIPGAGSMVGTNQLYVAKPNGLTFAILTGVGMIANQIGGSPVVKYDAMKFTYLGRVVAERRVVTASLNSKVKDLESLIKSPVPVKQALTGPGAGAYVISQLVLKSLGFPREEVLGYQSSAEAEMSLIRGETDIHFTSEDAAMTLIERKEVRAIFQLAPKNIDGLENIPNLLTKDVEKLKLSEKQLKSIRIAGDLMALGYIIGAPPRIPPERAWVLEEAVQKTLRDPKFVALCKKSGGSRDVDPLTGKEVFGIANRLLNISPDLKAEMQALMKAK